MGMEKHELHNELLLRRTMKVFDDWRSYTTGGEWTSVTAGSATVAAGDNTGGILTLSTIDSTNNQLVGVKQTNSLFLFQATTPIYCEALLQYSEANTSAANVAFGLMNAVSSTALGDDGAGPKASFSGAVIYKIDGGTVWRTRSSVLTTYNDSVSVTTAGGSTYQRLGILIEPTNSTVAEVTYYVDGVQLSTTGGRPGQSAIKDQLTYTSASQMQLFACIKSGSTTPEILKIDYIAAEMTCRQFGLSA